jgi:hypothetical protein
MNMFFDRRFDGVLWDQRGNYFPEHQDHLDRGWSAGFDAGYRRATRDGLTGEDRIQASVYSGLDGLARVGCAGCLEFMAGKSKLDEVVAQCLSRIR